MVECRPPQALVLLLALLCHLFPTPAASVPARCPPAVPSQIPRDWSNGKAVLATAGWYAGRYLDYFDNAHGRSLVNVTLSVFAGECYKWAVCGHFRDDVAFISWKAITHSGTKGLCLMFQTSTCSPLYAPKVKGLPYVTQVKDWYSTYVAQPPNSLDCDAFLPSR